MKVFTDSRVPIKAWTDHVALDPGALAQLEATANLPFIYKHLAVMPDVHVGLGSTIGSVIPTLKAVIPAAVGVDIGCGMMAGKLNLKAKDLPDNLLGIRTAIETAIPHGWVDGTIHDSGTWRGEPPQMVESYYGEFLQEGLEQLLQKHPKLNGRVPALKLAPNHMGTLGTGNHFIELCIDEKNEVWIMLHSGSRGIGNRIGRYFIEKAKGEMEKWHIDLKSKDLAYLPEGTELFTDYWVALTWAQNYARINREMMMDRTVRAVDKCFKGRRVQVTSGVVNCHHNYAEREHHFGRNIIITRKGAVCARRGMKGIIPGSMGDRSFIVEGKGNLESFTSCSHGAGRVMSRRQAKDEITLKMHSADTDGVECRKDSDVLDESPRAYKRIEDVMKSQDDLVRIVHTLKQVVCVKG